MRRSGRLAAFLRSIPMPHLSIELIAAALFALALLHTFAALNVEDLHETHFDTTEETEVELVPLEDVPGLVASGVISHALVVSAFYLFDLWRTRSGR